MHLCFSGSFFCSSIDPSYGRGDKNKGIPLSDDEEYPPEIRRGLSDHSPVLTNLTGLIVGLTESVLGGRDALDREEIQEAHTPPLSFPKPYKVSSALHRQQKPLPMFFA